MRKIFFITVLFLSAMLVAAQCIKRGFATIEVVVHRGANFLAPENTVASADSALAHGATWIEVDVRSSRDGVLYNMHDPTLDRPELFSRIQTAMSGKTTAVPANMGLQWERYGGVYRAYPEDRHTYTSAPAGYTAFYISHFARHGSRWLPDDRRYEAVLEQFADTLNLTPLGLDVRHRLLKIYADARGRGGDLTSVGAAQHDRMALRMVQNFPSVFTDSALVSARSSTVGRCVMSMNAFLVSLARTRPAVRITAEANRRYMDYIAYTSTEERLLEDTVRNIWLMNPRRLMSTLFRDPSRIAAPRDLASELHTIASDMQNTDIGVSLYDIFTEAEMRQIYDMNNRRMQRCNGINSLNGGTPERCAASLWRNIEVSADSAVCRRLPSATLRFGHDTSLYRLLSLLGLFAGESRMDVIIPMGANLQIIFYRNRANDVIVKFMHNEREILLPGMPSELPAPYYRWADVRRAVDRRLAELGM